MQGLISATIFGISFSWQLVALLCIIKTLRSCSSRIREHRRLQFDWPFSRWWEAIYEFSSWRRKSWASRNAWCTDWRRRTSGVVWRGLRLMRSTAWANGATTFGPTINSSTSFGPSSRTRLSLVLLLLLLLRSSSTSKRCSDSNSTAVSSSGPHTIDPIFDMKWVAPLSLSVFPFGFVSCLCSGNCSFSN